MRKHLLLYGLCLFGFMASGKAFCQERGVAEEGSPKANFVNELSQLKSFYEPTDEYLEKVTNIAQDALEKDGVSDVDMTGLITVVDRSPKHQSIMIFDVSPSSQTHTWENLYTGHVSTGKPGRKEHYRTPVGVFKLDGSILDYRAEGTFNQNHIRGIGLKGSRVWDFGWVETDDWRTKGAMTKIRMEMHATDPANLELRIGRPDSEGCIRIHADLNHVMDKYGVLDAAPNDMAQSGNRAWKQVLGKDHVYLESAGKYVVIIDTEETH